MKRMIVYILIVFLTACVEQSDKVKIIENYDDKFLTDKNIDVEPGTEEQIERFQNDIKEIVKNISGEHTLPVKAYLNFRMYINNEGKVEAISSLKIPEEWKKKDEEFTVLSNNKNIFDGIASTAEDWEFKPAVLNGEPVNFRSDIELILTVDEEGKVSALEGFGKSFSAFNTGKLTDYMVMVEQPPVPIGGLEAIQQRITYPEKAKRAGIEGRVFIKAYINEKGDVVETEVLKGIGGGCDSVAVKAVKESKFEPGKQRGEPVKVQVSIPIVFKLQ